MKNTGFFQRNDRFSSSKNEWNSPNDVIKLTNLGEGIDEPYKA